MPVPTTRPILTQPPNVAGLVLEYGELVGEVQPYYVGCWCPNEDRTAHFFLPYATLVEAEAKFAEERLRLYGA